MKKILLLIKKILNYTIIFPEAIFKTIFNIKTEAIDFPIPWITYEAKEWLESYLDKNMQAFEWGSGGSTLFLASKINKVTSVEHDRLWYTKVKTRLYIKKVNNCEYKLVTPELDVNNKVYSPLLFEYKSSCDSYLNNTFKKYCQFIDNYPNNYFDLIIIDGRARNSCVLHAKEKLKKGGCILLDNSEHEEYNLGVSKLSGFERKDFFGEGPFVNIKWRTTFFIKK